MKAWNLDPEPGARGSAEEGAPQCFLLTPKLLSGLDYNRHVTILGIFNGSLISSVAKNFKSVRARPWRSQWLGQRVGGSLP